MPGPLQRERAATAAGRRLPPDEREIAARLLAIAGDRLAAAEHELCIKATRPGAPPLDWRNRLRLSVAAGRLLGGSAP
jgi:hypothetical protein